MLIPLRILSFLKSSFVLLSVSVLCLVSGATFAQDVAADPSSISRAHYQLNIVAEDDGVSLVVRATVTGDPDATIPVGAPRDTTYGTPRLERFLVRFEGDGGTHLVESSEDGGTHLMTLNSDGYGAFVYALRFEPSQLRQATFSPNTGPTHFHASCAQWMPFVGEPDRAYEVSIEWGDTPENWTRYSSLGQGNHTLQASRVQLRRVVFGAMEGQPVQFTANDGHVSVHVVDAFQLPTTTIAHAVEEIIRQLREFFDGETPSEFSVAILPKDGNVAGVAVAGHFTCFVKRDVNMTQLYVLLAHEIAHGWISDGQFEFGNADEVSENFVRNQWFYEGMAEYVARWVLLRSDIMTRDEFCEMFNRDVINIADNPYGDATFEEIMQIANDGRFSTSHAKLSYYRGALIALGWESQLEQQPGETTVALLVARLHEELSRRDELISYDAFFDLLDSEGLRARDDFQHYILNGEAIPLPSRVLGEQIAQSEMSIPSFEPGFDVRESVRRGEVRGVIENGPAYAAGLRDGMKLSNVENASRFSNAWDYTKPLVVNIVEEGKARAIEYFPHGAPHRLRLYDLGDHDRDG